MKSKKYNKLKKIIRLGNITLLTIVLSQCKTNGQKKLTLLMEKWETADLTEKKETRDEIKAMRSKKEIPHGIFVDSIIEFY